MANTLHTVLHVLIAITLPPLLNGVINRTKAAFAGRNGPPLLQRYYDLARLFRKGSVFSTTTTWLFKFGPVVMLVTTALAVLVVPLGYSHAPLSFGGDFLLFCYLLALGRFFLVAAALDTGSSFEGMGAAREVTYACLAEPAMILGLMVTAKVYWNSGVAGVARGFPSLADMFGGHLPPQWGIEVAAISLVFVSWFIVMLLENCRIPFDDPNTHLELTMIHEVIVLDHSGPTLGLILYGASMKLFIFAALLVRLVIPLDLAGGWLDWFILVAGVLVVAFLIGVVESTMARLRLPYIPNLLIAAGVLSAFGLLLLVSHS